MGGEYGAVAPYSNFNMKKERIYWIVILILLIGIAYTVYRLATLNKVHPATKDMKGLFDKSANAYLSLDSLLFENHKYLVSEINGLRSEVSNMNVEMSEMRAQVEKTKDRLKIYKSALDKRDGELNRLQKAAFEYEPDNH